MLIDTISYFLLASVIFFILYEYNLHKQYKKDLDSEKYFNRLNTFVSTLREDYKTYGNFRFVDAAILKSEYSDKINKSKSEFANLSDNNYYFEVAEFNFSLIDDVNYNAASEYKLGYEFGKYCF